MVSAQAVDPAAAVDPTKGQSLAKTLIGSAQFQLNIAQEAYVRIQKNYQRATEVFVEQNTRMAKISTNLSRLASESLNLVRKLPSRFCVRMLKAERVSDRGLEAAPM